MTIERRRALGLGLCAIANAAFSACRKRARGVETSSGLVTEVLHPGIGGEHPVDSDRVRVHYTGWTSDGAIFDSSARRGAPGLFTMTQMIAGWSEALKSMSAGEKRRIWVPRRLAYGDSPAPGAPRGDLTFEIELVEIIHAPKPPRDVTGPPPDSLRTRSGIAYRVLRSGTGTTHPKETDDVVVQYSGWTTDALLFDSSILRDGPVTFSLPRVIPGFREAIESMVEGEMSRFWIPANLAYGEHPADPELAAGMLVYDVELVRIV